MESIDSPREHPFDYQNIYAQAYALYRQGFRYWFTQEEIQRLAIHNAAYETPRLELELIDTYFRRPNDGEYGEFMPVARALQIVAGNLVQKLSVFNLGRAFTDMGFEKVVRSHVRGYIVVQRSAEEIKARQIMLSRNRGTDGTEIF